MPPASAFITPEETCSCQIPYFRIEQGVTTVNSVHRAHSGERTKDAVPHCALSLKCLQHHARLIVMVY